jgi:hypothetical protein
MARTRVTLCAGSRSPGTVIVRASASKAGGMSGGANWTRTHIDTPGAAGERDLSPTGEDIGRASDRTPKWWNYRPLLSVLLMKAHPE